MLPFLPPKFNHQKPELLTKTVVAARFLGELKGVIKTIPNEKILLDTLLFSEAQASSAIENIITTQNELYRANIGDTTVSPATKEAKNYADAVKHGYQLIQDGKPLTTNAIREIQKINSPNHHEIRKIPGTILKNDQTGETVYSPPQNYDEIIKLLSNLENFINQKEMSSLDPIIKMAIIHHQFESIHPFHDGNGRMGRILNVLYLTQEKLLDLPILYLSRYIIKHKSDYYRLLQEVRDKESWLEWCCWLIDGVSETCQDTISKVQAIRELMLRYKQEIRDKYKFYSQDLINVLFRYPYTKIEFLENELNVSRPTATKYLNDLDEGKYLKKIRLGRDSFYFNHLLFDVIKGENE